MITFVLISSCGFYVRLSGAPNYAMLCAVVAAVINIILDYLLIFVFNWGMFGAAFATGIGTIVGVVMMILYLMNRKNVIHLVFIKTSTKRFRLPACIPDYITKPGISSFPCDAALALLCLCAHFFFLVFYLLFVI